MLLVEYTVLDNLKVINETTSSGQTKLKLRGRFQKCDEQNNNGRIYPRKILEGQVKKIQEKIGDRSLVGALDHPANDAIHLSQASHLITGLSVDKSGDVIGECEILSTPNGKIVQSLINDGVKIGISSRGVGSVSEGREGKIVNEDFKLITFDLVSDPSTKGAFPELTESIRENSQRAQAIISKHKKDRVLMTMLESKVNEKLNEGYFSRRATAKKDAVLRAGDKIVKPGAMKGTRVKRPKANRTDYKGMSANQVIDTPVYPPKPGNKPDNTTAASELAKKKAQRSSTDIIGDPLIEGSKKKAKKMVIRTNTGKGYPDKAKGTKDNDPLRLKLLQHQKPATDHTSKKDLNNTNIIGNALMEGFKKVCWGDRYDEGPVKDRNKAHKRRMLSYLGKTMGRPDQADSEDVRIGRNVLGRKHGRHDRTPAEKINIDKRETAKLRKKSKNANLTDRAARQAKGEVKPQTGTGRPRKAPYNK